jgi:hypothetical protein
MKTRPANADPASAWVFIKTPRDESHASSELQTGIVASTIRDGPDQPHLALFVSSHGFRHMQVKLEHSRFEEQNAAVDQMFAI